MELVKLVENNFLVIKVEGKIDSTNNEQFNNYLVDIMKENVNLIIDLEKLDYISSAGLRVFLSTHKAVEKAGGCLKIRNVNDDIMEIFDMTGFSSFLNIED